jgi:hypothetical protein
MLSEAPPYAVHVAYVEASTADRGAGLCSPIATIDVSATRPTAPAERSLGIRILLPAATDLDVAHPQNW